MVQLEEMTKQDATTLSTGETTLSTGETTLSTGEMLKRLRRERNLTLQAVADAVGCSPSYLHRLENSNRKNPSMKMATTLARFYEVDVSLLSGIEADMANSVEVHELKEDLADELKKTVTHVKDVLQYIDIDTDVSKKSLIKAYKNLLYMQSLL